MKYLCGLLMALLIAECFILRCDAKLKNYGKEKFSSVELKAIADDDTLETMSLAFQDTYTPELQELGNVFVKGQIVHKIMDLKGKIGGMAATQAISMHSRFIIPHEFTSEVIFESKNAFSYLDGNMDHEFIIQPKTPTAAVQLFENPNLKKYIQNVDVRYAQRSGFEITPERGFVYQYQNMPDEVVETAQYYIDIFKDQLKSFTLTATEKQNDYILALKPMEILTEVTYEGVLKTNGQFQFNKTFPAAKIIRIKGEISTEDEDCLKGYTQLEKFEAWIGSLHFNELKAQEIIVACKAHLHEVILTKCEYIETIQKIAQVKHLEKLSLGLLEPFLWNYKGDPIPLPTVKYLNIDINLNVIPEQYRPAYKCNVEYLNINAYYWSENIVHGVITRYTKNYYGISTNKVKKLNIHVRGTMTDLKYLIQTITDVEEIGVDEYFKHIPLLYENDRGHHILLEVFKACPNETNLKKVILYNVPASKLDGIFLIENQLKTRMPDDVPKWDMTVDQYNNFGRFYWENIKRVARVTFTKC